MDKIAVLVPIKENSNRLPRKNFKKLKGVELWKYAYDAALVFSLNERYNTWLYVSSEYLDLSKEFIGKRFIHRPRYLSEDPAQLWDVCKHALGYMEPRPDTLIVAQPSNPFVKAEDIKNCYDLFIKHDRKTVRSVTKINKQVWRPMGLYEGKEPKSERVKVITPYSTNSFVGNGSIVIMDVQRFLKEKTLADIVTIPYVMPPERSIDIDTELDFYIAQMIMERKL